MILLKLDISKALDTVSWSFLLEMLEFRGFGAGWRRCLSALLLTAETSLLINGITSDPVKLARGLRQGDPLSLLFVLVMDTLEAIMTQARTTGLLSPLNAARFLPSTSVYADDAVIFFRPVTQEALVIQAVLDLFGEATGLKTNLAKSAITPIQCNPSQIQAVEAILHCQVQHFPITYLGLPLSTRKPTKAEIQPILDRLAKKVAGWKPKLLSIDGRLCLVNSVLQALPVHFMTVLQLPKWAVKDIERKCRGFLWKGQEKVNGGHCLVSWRKLCMPIEKGGLVVMDLDLFGQALRLKWHAKSLEQKGRPWTSMLSSIEWRISSSAMELTLTSGRRIGREREVSLGDGPSCFLMLGDHV